MRCTRSRTCVCFFLLASLSFRLGDRGRYPALMNQMEHRTFGLKHLVSLVTASAVLFAICPLSYWFAVISCPLLVGPIVAHAISPSLRSVFAGMFSASFWSALNCAVVGVTAIGSYQYSGGRTTTGTPEIWLLSITLLSSIIGGYLGARISTH